MSDRSRSLTSTHKRPLTVALLLTSVYLVCEVAGGIWTHSLALIADAGHMLTDVAGLSLSLLAIHFADRPASEARTYGYYRVEILAALGNAVLLIGVSVYILIEAYQRWLSPPEISTGVMLAVAAVGLAVNLGSARLLRSGAAGSLNVQGAYLEVLSDLLASIGVIAAAFIMRLTSWYKIDPLLSAAIGLFILPRTVKLMWTAVNVLLEGTPADVDLAKVREVLSAVDGVASVHEVHVWALTSGMNALTAHVVADGRGDAKGVLEAVRRAVTGQFGVQHVTVQLEPPGFTCGDPHQ